jgi:uncharacterized protein (DUF2126 family)
MSQLFPAVGSRYLDSNPGLAFWDYGKTEADHKDAPFVQAGRHVNGRFFFTDHNWHNRMDPGLDPKTTGPHFRTEKLRILVEFPD